MKKYLFLLIAMAWISHSFAQDDDIVIRGTSKINKNLTPKVVIDSLNKKFPNAKAVQYYKTPADAAKNGWTITTENDLDASDEIDYYTISFKRDNMKYYGLYKANGELVTSKLAQSVKTLPAPIQTSLKSLSTQYPGYKVISKTYYKNTNYSKHKEHYEIIAEKGKEQKRLYYDGEGNLVKVKG
ncbi:hypothetical protein [Paraflavitalea sp. CAU 1676]|uniref:hypothetical protein n=1 Tax=Paraflavitalea sp. CAU 1676 TaxID=3032598 RepID=UPI0023DAEF0D|nr:hypothetical protein [Paraflavitalea sp. CAU 1676]MDF2191579.1 hypothetical protein [Paraflavitalea sp. CAU 1676]